MTKTRSKPKRAARAKRLSSRDMKRRIDAALKQAMVARVERMHESIDTASRVMERVEKKLSALRTDEIGSALFTVMPTFKLISDLLGGMAGAQARQSTLIDDLLGAFLRHTARIDKSLERLDRRIDRLGDAIDGDLRRLARAVPPAPVPKPEPPPAPTAPPPYPTKE